MILTYKIKHNTDFSNELIKAIKVAKFAIANRDKLSSKYVKHFGLKSAIACQILRKYGMNKKCKIVSKIKLVIPNQVLKYKNCCLTIKCLNLKIKFVPRREIVKINQVEIDNKYCYIACTVKENDIIETKTTMGIDLNTTGHCAVAAVPETGKVFKLGKQASHVHKKYSKIRKHLQKNNKRKLIKKIKNRESRIVRDLNHKISRKVVNEAINNKSLIVLENLKTFYKNRKCFNKLSKNAVNSWSYFTLGSLILYKAKLAGIPVAYIDPRYTSQMCSKCGLIGERNGKQFKCHSCGHVENADVNAAFNIALKSSCVSQLHKDRDLCKGNSDIPKEATANALADFKACAT